MYLDPTSRDPALIDPEWPEPQIFKSLPGDSNMQTRLRTTAPNLTSYIN